MPSKMEVNAAIERLISDKEFNLEAARTIISFGLNIKPRSRISCKSYCNKKDDPSTKGYVSGVGEVEYEGPREENVFGKNIGAYEERVGNYKLTRASFNGHIRFRHFWKADFSTAGNQKDISIDYHLYFNRKTFEPIALAVDEEPIVIPFFFLPISLNSIIIMRFGIRFVRYIKGKNVGRRVRCGFWLSIGGKNYY